MNEKEMLELIKNCFKGSRQGTSYFRPSAPTFACCGSPEALEENKNAEKEN